MLKDAYEFTNKIKDFDGVISVVLFGSVARGEATKDSDIDLMVIYSIKSPEIIKKINSLATENLEILHFTLDELEGETTLTGALSGEGILLYGKPVTICMGDVDLKSQMLIAYDTGHLARNIRSTLYRSLYGGTSTYLKEGEKKSKYYPGIVEQVRAQKIANSVLLVDRHNAPEIIKTLQRFKARWKEIPVWTY
jgi:predicted nucleotidyltransferase